jgi:hypothetical protein
MFSNTIKIAALLCTHSFSNRKERKTDAIKIDQPLSSYNTSLTLGKKKQMSSESPIKLGLRSLHYWFQKFKSGWNSGKVLLICRLLLESPSSFLVSPDLPANEAGS